jgi:hypothetical protein
MSISIVFELDLEPYSLYNLLSSSCEYIVLFRDTIPSP